MKPQPTQMTGRKIEFKPTDVIVEGTQFTYAHLILACLNAMPKGGWTTSLMRERMNVEAKISVDAQEAELTNGDIAIIKDCVKNFAWGMKHKDLIEFEDYIMSL